MFFYWYFLLLQLWAQGGGCKSSIFHPGIECNFTLMMTLMISKMIIIVVLMMRMVLMMMLELVAVLTESHSDFTLLTGLGNQTSSGHVAIAWLLQHLVTLAISSINQVSSCHSYSITVSTILPGKKLIFNLAMKFTNKKNIRWEVLSDRSKKHFMGLFLFGGIDTEQSESYWLTQMTTKPHIIIQRYYVFSFERLNQTRPSKQCRFCDYLLDLSLISQDCQSC